MTTENGTAGAYPPLRAHLAGALGGDVGEDGHSAESGPGHHGHAPVGPQDRCPYFLEVREPLLVHRRLDLLFGNPLRPMARRRNPPS